MSPSKMARESFSRSYSDPHAADDLLDSETQSPDQLGLDFGPGNYEAIKQTCEAIGQVIESWGFKKIMGMTWAFLYLCPEPASAKDICDALNVSPALVSMTLQDLQRWEVVKKLSPMGKRRDYYVAEHDIWKMIRRVFKERERQQMDRVHTKLLAAVRALDDQKEIRPDLKSRRTCQFQKLRVEDLLNVTKTAMGLMDTFVDAGELNIAPLFSALKPYTMLTKQLKS